MSDDEKVYFYGNDMQRYDYSKKGLLDYYEVVNKDEANNMQHSWNMFLTWDRIINGAAEKN